MLEVCPSIAKGKPSCEIHPLSIGGKADPVRLVFDAAEGPAVIVGQSVSGGAATIAAATAPDLIVGLAERAPFTRKPSVDLGGRTESGLQTSSGGPHAVLENACGTRILRKFAKVPHPS